MISAYAAQLGQQILGMDWLGQNLELVALGARLLKQVGRGCLAGKEQDLDLRQQGADPDRRVDAVQIGHDDVGDEHIRLKCRGQLDGLFAGIDGAGFKAALVQNHGQRVGNDSFIVDDQHLGFELIFGHTLLEAESSRRRGSFMAFNAIMPGTATMPLNDTLCRQIRFIAGQAVFLE